MEEGAKMVACVCNISLNFMNRWEQIAKLFRMNMLDTCDLVCEIVALWGDFSLLVFT